MINLKANDLVWAKVKPNAIIPTKNKEDMGRDIYACFDEDYMVIPPHTTKLIPTGLACAMTDGYGIRLRDRGSNGSRGIHVNAGSIDSGFRGQIFVAWCNTNDKDVILSKLTYEELIQKYSQKDNDGDTYILEDLNKDDDFNNRIWCDVNYEDSDEFYPIVYPYTKAIAQAEVVIVPVMDDKEISYEELLEIPSKRGTGMLGSTSK